MKAVDAVDHRLGVGADRRGHARQGRGHVLQQLEGALAPRPFVIGQRHDADMGARRARRPRSPSSMRMRSTLTFGPLRKARADDAQLQRRVAARQARQRRADHLQINEVLRTADPSDGGRSVGARRGRPVRGGVDRGRQDLDDLARRGTRDAGQDIVAGGDHVHPAAGGGEFSSCARSSRPAASPRRRGLRT